MKYRYLGNSGLLVSRICFGNMTFGNRDWGCDQETATAITRRFVDKGGNFIDTADLYNSGVSEEMLGKAIGGLSRDELVIASKCWFPTGGGPNARGLSRKHITEACEASLRRMKIDYIDLYQIHGPDPHTPVAETMRSLDDLVRSGKVRYIGCSNLYAWQIVKANAKSTELGLESFISGQYLYNLVRRDIEREILPACDDQGMGMLCWSPLASGLMTGKYKSREKPAEDTRYGKQAQLYLPRFWNEDSLNLVDLVVRIAEELERTAAQVALAWLLGDDRVTAPIVGARTVAQLEENIVAGDWDLPPEIRQQLTDALPLDYGYPKEWMDISVTGTFGKEEMRPRRSERLP